MLWLESPTKILQRFWKRRHEQARGRLKPSNLKQLHKTYKPSLTTPVGLPSPKWVGPWVTLASCQTSTPLSRILLYAYNSAQLWVAQPARLGLHSVARVYLTAALRGLTGLASLKLRFKGKSFRWHRRRQALVLRFGYSHLVTCTPPFGTRWKRGGKTKMLFFNSNITLLRSYLTAVVAWREPNRYHSRGLRLARQRIMRKAGKVSAYR